MRLTTLLTTSASVAGTAVAGVLATDPDSLWYRTLRKPEWQPPSTVFPLVWTPLYAGLAVTSAVALDELEESGRRTERAAYRRALTANLVLNAGWSWLFWRGRRPWLAAAECAVLAVSSADLVRRTSRARPVAGAALAPYAAWCGFATVLSTAIAMKNPRR
ncbi:TspO/MBR family protein [Ornithinimicrobium avium]|uniref:Tryptophan-rich sensory protein n=1 Tax=Ornithinimicrobium avium TaxID=2283195 RepID=A0A345NSW3_9MICO|nr:TspO/MBR family protein [Ornithinimicrobium avium]AXH98121.1 tryptophan-rich sensory protein [Ornithinimicrobium avium]